MTPESTTLDELERALAAKLASDELELPVLPATAAKVLELCRNPESDALELAAVLQRDPALAAHVLRVANSAAFAPEERIVSLQQAVGRLGMSNVRDICVGVALRTRAFSVPGQEARVKVLWTHSALAAAWARELARALRRNVEGAFLGGLLHDVGKPVVLQAAGDLAALLGLAPEERELERWMHEHHAAVGARLAHSWALPAWMAEAVRFHHEVERAGDALQAARMVHVADLLAHLTARPDEARERELFADPSVAGLELYPDELEALLARREHVVAVAGSWS